MPRLDLDDFLPYLLVNLSKRLSAALAETYQRDHALTIAEWRVMANLNQSGALTSKEIGRQTYMDKVKVSRAVKSLVAKDWVVRRPRPEDSRSHTVSLTAAGRAVIRDVIPRVLQWQASLLDALSERERATLMRVIGKLDRRLDEQGRVGEPDNVP